MSEEEIEAIEYLSKYIKSDLFYEQEHYNRIKIVLNLINKLQKELEQEQKLTNLIIDDFQAENYFINMTNKEVRKYYSERKELK